MPCGLNKSPLKGTRDVMKLYFKRTTVCALILFLTRGLQNFYVPYNTAITVADL